MTAFVTSAILNFFVAFGVVMGGSMLAGIGSVLSLQPPTYKMLLIAENIKIWAMVAAIGGTIDPIRMIQDNFQDGQFSPAFKQILLIISAYIGAHMGTSLIQLICKGGGQS
ncbi:YtrH family sporulation protein [Paenibacillus sp. 1P03SA]|uniref:YtrH family sporulation protein n=1 Tax=Paenibacillus sp. 1P03SA TaxID=3132294 RepID=UPI0039A3F017